ncbi:unnamed protein product, partial [Ectocarpus sp. 8 AP-2014]
ARGKAHFFCHAAEIYGDGRPYAKKKKARPYKPRPRASTHTTRLSWAGTGTATPLKRHRDGVTTMPPPPPPSALVAPPAG